MTSRSTLRSLAFRSPLVLPLVLLASPGLAEEGAATTEAEAESVADDHEIIVLATRIKGQVEAAQPPIMTLNEGDIASYGASSLSDLITALSPQTGSGRGRGGGHPVILFNGQRISNFREMRNIPPEAIRRMEILPEEVALRYGFAPNQRVVNFILKDNFATRTIDAEVNLPTRGGFAETEFEASLLKIDKASRFNLNVKAEDSSMLTEAERGVVQQSAADQALWRSLVSDSRTLTLNTSWSTALGEGGGQGSLSANAAVIHSDTRSLFGREALANATDGGLTLTRKTDSYQVGGAWNRPLGAWSLTATLDGGTSQTDTWTDQRRGVIGSDPRGRDFAKSRSDSLATLGTVSGSLFRLPAGDVATTFKAGFAYTGIRSLDSRSGGAVTNLKRGDLSGGINLAVPVTSRKEGVLEGVGDITLNFSAGINRLSDYGTLKDWSAGVTWAPTDKLGIQVSYLVNDAAPSLTDLGAPTLRSDNVAVYDFTRNETALVTVISGGNPLLRKEQQRDLKVSANWELPFMKNSSLLVEFFRNRSSDMTAAFPTLTPDIEAAFPGRVVRDGSGRLVSIDRRPVTLSNAGATRIRYGFNVSGTIGKAPPGRASGGMGAPARGPGGPGGMGRGGGPMMGMMGGAGGQGRWNLSVFHMYRFDDFAQVTPGGLYIDQINGGSLGGSGVARHALELEGGAFRKGFGLRFNGTWQSPTSIKGTTDLRFGSAFKLNLRAFVDFDRQKSLVEAVPLLKGARLSFTVDNLFDSHQRVTDASGTVPIGYQPDLIDPKGRMVGIDFRKMF